MTTSTFTSDAREYADQIDTEIVVFDGHDVGCALAQTFVVKKLDSDCFVEE